MRRDMEQYTKTSVTEFNAGYHDRSGYSDMIVYDSCLTRWDRLLHLTRYEHAWQEYVYNATAPTCTSTVFFDDPKIAWECARLGCGDYPPYNGIGNRTTSIITVRPEVSTLCLTSGERRNHNYTTERTGRVIEEEIFYAYENRTSAGVLFDVQTIVDRASNFSGSSSTTTFDLGWTPSYEDLKGVAFPPIWSPSPEPGSHSLIGVFPYWTQSEPTDELPQSLPWLFKQEHLNSSWGLSIDVCTISAFWNTGEIQLIEQSGSGTAHTAVLQPHQIKPITLDVADAESLQGSKFYCDIINTADLGAGLSILFASALSAINNDTLLTRQMPLSYDKHNTSAFKYTTILYGYGYSSTTVSVQLAMTVIIAYCVITVAYIAYVLVTGSTSTAWNSAIELVGLALQSKRPDHLGNIAVGLDSIKTFKEGVGIRVNQDDELELVFAHDCGSYKEEFRRIKYNKEY